jgi:hypothetical protein
LLQFYLYSIATASRNSLIAFVYSIWNCKIQPWFLYKNFCIWVFGRCYCALSMFKLYTFVCDGLWNFYCIIGIGWASPISNQASPVGYI